MVECSDLFIGLDVQPPSSRVAAHDSGWKWWLTAVLFRTLFDDGFPGLLDAVTARISSFVRSFPERWASAHGL